VRYGYDVKCEELAQSFIEDLPKRLQSEERVRELAQVIQDAIENWWPDEEEGK
jgi:hypothetical protein